MVHPASVYLMPPWKSTTRTVSRRCPPGSLRLNGNINRKVPAGTHASVHEWPGADSVTTFQMTKKHTGFNKGKYLSYILYLEAKEFNQ